MRFVARLLLPLVFVALSCLLIVGCTTLEVSPELATEAEVAETQTVSSVSSSDSDDSDLFPGASWSWAESPEARGWSSEKLAEAQSFSRTIGSAAVMIIDDGLVIDAWGEIDRIFYCHSMRKSLVSGLYGIYVEEGAIDLTRTLAELGIDDLTPLTQTESQATVADLLKARSGIYIRAAGEAKSMADARPQRGSHAPGTYWYYNNWDFNALGTIFDQETGVENIYAAFEERIAEPIGMEDFRSETLSYSYVDYTMHPYYGFNMSARDLARFGLLFLREGNWNGEQIIPAKWVRESTTSYSDTGDGGGYGYMWWTGTSTGLFPGVTVQSHSYYASGYGGHKIIVLPYKDLVVVHRVNTFEPGVEISTSQIGILLWLILDAAGETGVGEPPFIDSAPGTHLSNRELFETIAESRWAATGGSSGMFVENTADGETRILLGDQLVYTGTWKIDGDRYCVDIPESEDIGGCFNAVLDGKDLRLFELNGMLSMRFVIED